MATDEIFGPTPFVSRSPAVDVAAMYDESASGAGSALKITFTTCSHAFGRVCGEERSACARPGTGGRRR
jgi:hypothetical protein